VIFNNLKSQRWVYQSGRKRIERELGPHWAGARRRRAGKLDRDRRRQKEMDRQSQKEVGGEWAEKRTHHLFLPQSN